MFTHEDGSYEEGVRHIQLAYAPYAVLLATFKNAGLLGGGLGIRPRFTERGLIAVRAAG